MKDGLHLPDDRENRWLRHAFDALAEGVAVFDAEDCLVFANGRFRASYRGLSELLVDGLPWTILMSEATHDEAASGLAAIGAHLAAGAESRIEVETERPDGRTMRTVLHPLADGGHVLTETDITADRSAEVATLAADDLLRSVLDACSSNLMMCRIGDGTILYRNPAWITLFGQVRSARQLYADPMHRSDFLTELLPTGSLHDFETALLRADGTSFPARVSARIIDYRGENAIVSSTQDMTQLYAQRDEIVRINQRLFDAIEALDQGFALFDADDRLLMANARFNSVNEPVGSEMIKGAARSDIIAAARSAGHEPLAAGAWPESAAEKAAYEFSLADGRTFAASRKPTSDGGSVLAWRDVTEARAAARELERQREASFQNEKLAALGELLAGIAHELNNPLSVVVGQALMLREDVEDAGLARRIDKISLAAERCAKIVKTFLSMARERPVSLSPVIPNAMIETVIDVIGHGMRAAGISVETDFATDLPPVMADEDQITQLVINLGVNAQHAVAGMSGPVVRFATFAAPGGGVAISVADNGPGVPVELRQRIFEPFFTTKDVGEGTGIGLALCHRIAVAHGGRLDVEPSPEGGARFTLMLPAAEPKRPPGLDVAASDLSVAGCVALVVEDEPDVAEMIADMLAGLGVEPLLAENGRAALDVMACAEQIDLVISDLRMPEMDGNTLYTDAVARYPGLADRFIFVTGDAMRREAESFRGRSGQLVLEKPVSRHDLLTAIGRVLGACSVRSGATG